MEVKVFLTCGITASIFLTGCCSLDCVAPLTPVKHYVEYWEKPGMTAKKRTEDWVTCGGHVDGSFSPTQRDIQQQIDAGFSRYEARDWLEKKLKECMRTKTYISTGRE